MKKNSRREGDSNPRSRKRLNGFRDRPIRPLSHLSQIDSVPKRIRTSGLWIRNPMLYPAELWAPENLVSRPPALGASRSYAAPAVHPSTGAARHPCLQGSLSGIPAHARPRPPCLRRGGDSNPRYPLEVQRLSRAPDSATLAPLQFQPPPGRTSTILNDPLNFALASVTEGQRQGDRRGRDSNPRNRGAAQRFSRPPPSTTRTPLPSTKNAHTAESTQQRAAAHSYRSPGNFTITITRCFVNKTAFCAVREPPRRAQRCPARRQLCTQTVHGARRSMQLR
jgi:hypothetical protein